MTQTRQNFTLSDGRNLEYLTNGLKSEAAIILHAGTTQDIAGWQTWLDYFASKGVFALSFGRSGYAGSTKQSPCQLLIIDLQGFYGHRKVSGGRTPVHSMCCGHCPDVAGGCL